jgi:transposase
MGRRPDVFVRPLSMDEGRKLARITRTAKDPAKLRRAIVVLMSGLGQAVRAITSLMQVSSDYVRDVIHAFNERGFDALNPKWSGGRPKTIGEQIRHRICLIARTSPADWGITAFSTWSLTNSATICWPAARSRRSPPRRCARSCAPVASRGRPPRPGRRPPIRTSSQRCTASSTSTTSRPPMAAWSVRTSSGR